MGFCFAPLSVSHDGFARIGDAFRSGRPSALHRGGRDPQHHQWCGKGSSRAGFGERADQGPGSGARRIAADARPARCRADAGRRKPARSCESRDAQCRYDARRSARLCTRCQGHHSIPRQHVGPLGISAEGAGRLPEPAPSYLDRRRGARKLRHRPRHPDRLRRSRARRRTRAGRRYRADPVQRRSPGAGHSPWRRTVEPAAGRFPRSGGAGFRRPDQFDRAACPCQRHTPRGSAPACGFARG